MTDEEKTIEELRRKYQIALEALKKYRGIDAVVISMPALPKDSDLDFLKVPFEVSLGKVADNALITLGE